MKIRHLEEADHDGIISLIDDWFECLGEALRGFAHQDLRACRLVARTPEAVVGWAALSAVSGRCVYAGIAGVSIYVSEKARGRKIGSRLLSHLIHAAEQENIWTLQAGIFPENVASVALHHRHGFRTVGTRERTGCLDGRWRDVLLMERRSLIVGK